MGNDELLARAVEKLTGRFDDVFSFDGPIAQMSEKMSDGFSEVSGSIAGHGERIGVLEVNQEDLDRQVGELRNGKVRIPPSNTEVERRKKRSAKAIIENLPVKWAGAIAIVLIAIGTILGPKGWALLMGMLKGAAGILAHLFAVSG